MKHGHLVYWCTSKQHPNASYQEMQQPTGKLISSLHYIMGAVNH